MKILSVDFYWDGGTAKIETDFGPFYVDRRDGTETNAPSQASERSGDSLHSDVVRKFEERITPHILRHWDRDRIVRFAEHLLGDACQECPKHNNALYDGYPGDEGSRLM